MNEVVHTVKSSPKQGGQPEDDSVNELSEATKRLLSLSNSIEASKSSSESNSDSDDSETRSSSEGNDSDSDDETDEAERKEAEDLRYSRPLTDFLNGVKDPGGNLSVEFQKFFQPSYKSVDVKCYAYCLVDSISYKLFGEEDFRAFIKSVRYIGAGTGERCCKHPFVKTDYGVDRKRQEIEKIWKKGGKLTAVCLSYFSKDHAKEIEKRMMAAFGAEHFKKGKFHHKYLWNSANSSNLQCKPPTKEQLTKLENQGVQLLYEAWKVYVDKPVVLEMMLSNPYAEAIRANDKKVKLRRAAQDFHAAAEEHHQAASIHCEDATQQYAKASQEYDYMKKEYAKADATVQKIETSLKKAEDESKGHNGGEEADKEDLGKLKKQLNEAKDKQSKARKDKERAELRMKSFGKCKSSTEKIKKEALSDLKAACEAEKTVTHMMTAQLDSV